MTTAGESRVRCFDGLGPDHLPATDIEKHNEIVSARVFIRQAARGDPLFALMLEDHKDLFENTAPEQGIKNWHIIAALLEDHGMEVSDEFVFNILSGQEAPAAQLAVELSTLMNPLTERGVALKRVGQAVPVRQRINPFVDIAPSAVETKKVKGGTNTMVAASIHPTRLYVQDSARFMKKRTYIGEQLEKNKEREIRMQRQREKRERDAQKAAEEAKRHALAKQQVRDEVQREQAEASVLFKGDPVKVAERQKRTELLEELEKLEAAATADERRLARLLKAKEHGVPLSPTKNGRNSPIRERNPPPPPPEAAPPLTTAASGGNDRKKTPPKLREQHSIPFCAKSPSIVFKSKPQQPPPSKGWV